MVSYSVNVLHGSNLFTLRKLFVIWNPDLPLVSPRASNSHLRLLSTNLPLGIFDFFYTFLSRKHHVTHAALKQGSGL